MAARSLRDAIILGLTANGVYLSEKQTRRLEGELRDFFAHEVTRSLGKPPIATDDSGEIETWISKEIHLNNFFYRIFEHIPAYRGKDDE